MEEKKINSQPEPVTETDTAPEIPGEETAEEKTARLKREAQRRYEKKYYRLNLVFPAGTKERIDALKLDKSNSAFIKDTVLAKLDELERILK